MHLDETGINIGEKRVWLHTCSSPLYTAYLAHGKRGKETMDDMGILGESSRQASRGRPAFSIEEYWNNLPPL